MPVPDPRLVPWKEVFLRGDIHPHMPPLATLVEMEGKFDGAAGFLQSLDPADPIQADLGVKVGALAARYATAVMENFGWQDGPGVPPPLNLLQTRTLVESMLAEVRLRVRDAWLRTAAEADQQDELTDAKLDEVLAGGGVTARTPAADSTVKAAPATGVAPDGGFRVDPDQFAVILGDKTVALGPTLEFRLIELLAERRGKACSHDLLRREVWKDAQTTSEAIYQVVKKLKNMLEANDITGVVIKGQGGYYTLTFS